MATRTLAQLREGFSYAIGGDIIKCTSSSIGAAAGAAVYDTSLKQYPDGHFNYWYVLLTSGAIIGQCSQVSDFISTSGTVTPTEAFSAQVADAVTFELHRYYPGGSAATLTKYSKHQALADAALELFPNLFLPTWNYDLVVDSILPNAGFEDWAAAANPDWWTESANATIAKNTTAAYLYSNAGGASLKITAAGDAYVSCKWPTSVVPELEILKGQSVTWYCPSYGSAADDVWLSIVDSAGSTTGTKNAVTGAFEILKVSHSINADATSIEFRCNVLDTKVGYFDTGWLEGGPYSHIYRVPSGVTRSINRVMVCRYDLPEVYTDPRGYDDVTGWTEWGHGNDRRLQFDVHPPSGYRLALQSLEPLTAPASDALTIELDTHQAQLLYAQAAVNLFGNLAQGATAEDRANFWEYVSFHSARVADFKASLGMRSKGPLLKFNSPIDPRG